MPQISRDKLLTMLDEATRQGYERGLKDGAAKMMEDANVQDRTADCEALKAVTELARATGQTIEAMCRAMYKGRGM
jgi:hypothetical protein